MSKKKNRKIIPYRRPHNLNVGAQLLAGAHHAVGDFAAQLAALDVHAAGQVRVVQGHGHKVARGHVVRAGDDLDGLPLPDVHLADV